MIRGILGKKIGMTQLFDENGTVVPVTVVKAGPCVVVQVKASGRDGYRAVQLGLVEKGAQKHVTKPLVGHFKKAGLPPMKFLREFPVDNEEVQVGAKVLATDFKEGEFIDVIGTSKGRGFQGVVRRHHFRGGPGSHGSMFHRAPGSIGASSYPSRTFKGMRMAGHMGNKRVTVKNLRIVQIDGEKNLMLVRGHVPGWNGAYVMIRKSVRARKQAPQPNEA